MYLCKQRPPKNYQTWSITKICWYFCRVLLQYYTNTLRAAFWGFSKSPKKKNGDEMVKNSGFLIGENELVEGHFNLWIPVWSNYASLSLSFFDSVSLPFCFYLSLHLSLSLCLFLSISLFVSLKFLSLSLHLSLSLSCLLTFSLSLFLSFSLAGWVHLQVWVRTCLLSHMCVCVAMSVLQLQPLQFNVVISTCQLLLKWMRISGLFVCPFEIAKPTHSSSSCQIVSLSVSYSLAVSLSLFLSLSLSFSLSLFLFLSLSLFLFFSFSLSVSLLQPNDLLGCNSETGLSCRVQTLRSSLAPHWRMGPGVSHLCSVLWLYPVSESKPSSLARGTILVAEKTGELQTGESGTKPVNWMYCRCTTYCSTQQQQER